MSEKFTQSWNFRVTLRTKYSLLHYSQPVANTATAVTVILVVAMEQNIIFCCGPKIWTRVVGWLGIVGAVYCTIQVPLLMSQASNLLHDMGNVEEAAFLDSSSTGINVTLFMTCILSVLVNGMLLKGNEQERPGFLIPWLVLSWISMVGVGIFALFCLFTGLFVFGLILLIETVVPAVFLYAVHKRYAEMKEAMEPRIPIPIYKV